MVHYHLGKITPDGVWNATKDDVTKALADPGWVDELHAMFGDTTDTIAQVKANNAALHAIGC